jgi:hypothetical protein
MIMSRIRSNSQKNASR